MDLSNQFHVIDFFLIFRILRCKRNESDDKEIMEADITAIKYTIHKYQSYGWYSKLNRAWELKNPTTASYDNI